MSLESQANQEAALRLADFLHQSQSLLTKQEVTVLRRIITRLSEQGEQN